MLTPQEVDQYIRLTFKQYGLFDYSVEWMKLDGRRLGQANPWEKKIELSPKVLDTFHGFKLVFLHELAHVIQLARMGGTYKVNGRNNFHGKIFKQCCRELGITHKTELNI
jgi:predicted SprT family Zn-dependent metalloprotease